MIYSLRKHFIFTFVIVTVSKVSGKFYNKTVDDYNKCTIHYSRSERNYNTFFEIADHFNSTNITNDIIFDFHFAVLAASDAHILLAPSSVVDKNDPVYEIVLGAGGNSFCDIRRMQKNAVMQSVRIKDLLSVVDIMPFWIHILKVSETSILYNLDGSIEVGKEGEEVPFLFWKDTDPIPLKVFSFCTWSGVYAKWYFDCPREDTTHKEIEKPLTHVEKLRKDLLTSYSPYVRPVYNDSDLTLVYMDFTTYYIILDEASATMSLKGAMNLQWQDEKLKWNPANYSDLKQLQIFHGEIWIPDLVLFNSVNLGIGNIFSDVMMTVNSTGWVEWSPPMHAETWCEASDLGNWPADEHTCSAVFGFARDILRTQLHFMNNETNLFGMQYSNSWEILEVTAEGNFGPDESVYLPSELSLNFKLKRSSESLSIVYFTPFFFVSAACLATFWVSPFGYLKITLGCSQILLTAIVLIALAIVMPGHPIKIPYFVSLYSGSMVFGVVNIIISIIVINMARVDKKQNVPHAIKVILTSQPLKWFFCLPNTRNEDEYGKLIDVTLRCNSSTQDLWILLGVFIDRIAFYIYLGLFITALTLRY